MGQKSWNLESTHNNATKYKRQQKIWHHKQGKAKSQKIKVKNQNKYGPHQDIRLPNADTVEQFISSGNAQHTAKQVADVTSWATFEE